MSDKRDYRDTVFLPKTDFPMKAGLPQKEPGILARWEEVDLYSRLRDARLGREKFILHDGPPYANGDIHIGHALNHVLKDMVVRTQSLLGKDAPYVPGWDCHGLPIEWKVEEQYRKKKRSKNDVPAKEFRAECRAYAQHWVDTQREQLKRLGINGDWPNPYLTMDFDAEATIVAELMKFAEAGNLYRGSKPVMWSPVEETALAEAEVEYEDIISTQIDVAFEITESPIKELVGAYAVIWTTTPWTIPVNQALAYGPDVEYRTVEIDGRRYLIADDLLESFGYRFASQLDPPRDADHPIRGRWKGSELAGTIARHPMHHLGGFYAAPRPFLPGDFVTTESGTGLVHMAPDHGEDDFELCKAHGIEPQFAVMDDGRYRDDWLWLGAHDDRRRSVINANFNAPDGPICSDLREAGALLAASADYPHSYPHSWRSKAKVIFRCTPQWFVPMDKPLGAFDYPVAHLGGIGGAVALGVDASETATLRELATKAIAETRFVPEKGRNRIGSMVEGRPDWVLSRQRAWGVPITLFVKNGTGDYLRDPAVNARVVEAVRQGGVDAWDEARKAEFLGPDYDAGGYEMVTDILDVWFDSGCTHAFVLESGKWPELQWPADLYLEGSDQHRGWFQSSLLESCATRGRAPYKAVLTHGFTMASDGRKMSKSLGNTVDPNKVMEQYGADIIRLWALSVDYTEDHRIGDEILKGVGDQYRRLRNTFRYLLGALNGYEGDAGDVGAVPELERYILALLAELDTKLRKAIDAFDFNTYTRLLVDFCNEDLSAFFFDIRKDCLYCDAPDSEKRRAYRAVLDILFHALVRYAAPVLVFTAEEVWQSRYPAESENEQGSVHLLEWPQVPQVGAAKAEWHRLRKIRSVATHAIELKRKEKEIRSSLEADIWLALEPSEIQEFKDVDWEELLISGQVELVELPAGEDRSMLPSDVPLNFVMSVPKAAAGIRRTSNRKCGRCWRHLPEVSDDGDLCGRCEDVVAKMDATA